MHEQGVVIKKYNGKLLVRVGQRAECAGCGVRQAGCGEGRSRDVEVKDTVGAGIGEVVRIKMPPGATLYVGSIFYLFPTVLFFAGLLLGSEMGHRFAGINPDLLSFVAGLFFVVLYYVVLGRRPDVGKRFSPRATRVVTVCGEVEKSGNL